MQLLHQDAFTFAPAAALNCLPQVPQFAQTERLQKAPGRRLKDAGGVLLLTAGGLS